MATRKALILLSGQFQEIGSSDQLHAQNIAVGTRTEGYVPTVQSDGSLSFAAPSGGLPTGMTYASNVFTLAGRQITNKSGDDPWNLVSSMYVPDLTAGHGAEFILGKREADYDRATWYYMHMGDNNSGNYQGWTFYAVGEGMKLYANNNWNVGGNGGLDYNHSSRKLTVGTLESLSTPGEIIIGGTGKLRFWNASGAYFAEAFGIHAVGMNGVTPFHVDNSSMLVGYTAGGSDYGQGNLYASGSLRVGLGHSASTTHEAGTIVSTSDHEITTVGKGLIVKSADGTKYRLTPANGGGSSIWTAV